MPSPDQHRKKAENNRKLLDALSLDDFPDWVVTVTFYTVVHVIERLRAAAGDGDSADHESRTQYVQQLHPAIHTAYSVLRNASHLARYGSNADFFRHFQREDIADRIVATFLVAIEEYAATQLENRSR